VSSRWRSAYRGRPVSALPSVQRGARHAVLDAAVSSQARDEPSQIGGAGELWLGHSYRRRPGFCGVVQGEFCCRALEWISGGVVELVRA